MRKLCAVVDAEGGRETKECIVSYHQHILTHRVNLPRKQSWKPRLPTINGCFIKSLLLSYQYNIANKAKVGDSSNIQRLSYQPIHLARRPPRTHLSIAADRQGMASDQGRLAR